jgi:hypothetical protein
MMRVVRVVRFRAHPAACSERRRATSVRRSLAGASTYEPAHGRGERRRRVAQNAGWDRTLPTLLI